MQLLPGFTPPHSSPPREVEDTKPLATFDLPAHLRPPTPPSRLPPAPPLPPVLAPDAASLLTAVKAEEDVDETLWSGAQSSAAVVAVAEAGAGLARGWQAGAGGPRGLGWAMQELKPAVSQPILPVVRQLPLGWGTPSAQLSSLVPSKRPAKDEVGRRWRTEWTRW